MSYPLFRWKPGDEVHVLHFDPERRSWRVELAGKVERVELGRVLVSGPRWRAWEGVAAGPKFPSEEQARRWAEGHPPAAPGINPRVSKG